MEALKLIDELVNHFTSPFLLGCMLNSVDLFKEVSFECKLLLSGCAATERVIYALEFCSSLDTNMHNELVEFANKTYKILLDDYAHIVTHHSDDLNRILQRYHLAKCNVNDCSILYRNYTNDSILICDDSASDDEFVFYRNLFDRIHCYLFHSYDVGLRINRQHIGVHADDDRTHESNAEYDAQFAVICKIIDKKAKTFKQLAGFDADRFVNNKFDINVTVIKGVTFIDGFFKYLQCLGIAVTDRQLCKLRNIILSEEYDTDALLDDICWRISSNIALECRLNSEEEKAANRPESHICVCGEILSKKKIKNCYQTLSKKKIKNCRVICDLCGIFIEDRDVYVYHCNANKTTTHPFGYDICLSCNDNLQKQQAVDNTAHAVNICDQLQQYEQYTKLADNSFRIGYRFYYWEYYKENEITLQQPLSNKYDHSGYKPHQLYIEAKYESIKYEVLNSRIYRLRLHQFKLSLTKATKYIESDAAKKIKSRFSLIPNVYKMYNISYNTPIAVDNLLSIILYCDWSKLCRHFSKTFRQTYQYEPIASIKQKNREYANWARVLRETCELFGENGDDCYYNEDGDVVYTARGPFFCGVSVVMALPQFNIRLCAPTSTSTKIEVATRFAGDGGIILQLTNLGHKLSTKLCSFNCSWLSNYSAEDERLFFGGAYRIQIETIRNIDTAQNFRAYIRPLYHFNCMIGGTSMIVNSPQQIIEGISRAESKIIENLIAHRLDIDNYRNKYCKYVNDTFEAFLNHQTQIVLHLPDINLFYRPFKHLIMDNRDIFKLSDVIMDNSTQLSDVIFKLFKHMKELIIYSMNYKSYEFNILDLLSTIQSTTTHRITVRIKTTTVFSESDWIFLQYKSIQSECDTNDKYKMFAVAITSEHNKEDALTITYSP